MKAKQWSIVTAWLLLCLPVMAATRFTATVTTGPRDEAIIEGLVDGPRARLEFKQGQMAGLPEGHYIVTRDGGKTITLVDPEEQTYMNIDPEQLASSLGDMMEAAKGFVQITFKDASAETLVDERGPTMLGKQTRRVKTRIAYKVEMSILGRVNESSVVREDEMWVTPELRDEGFSLWRKKQHFETGDATIDSMIAREMDKIQGFPLKMVSLAVKRDSRGREETSTTTFEITKLESTRASSGDFEVPEGYKDGMVELRNEMGRARRGADGQGAGPGGDGSGAALDAMMRGLFGGER